MTENEQVEANGSGSRKRLAFLTDWLRGSSTTQASTTDDPFLRIHLDDDRKEVSSDELDKKYSRPAAEYDHPMWRLGWTDGRSGQPANVNEKLLEAHARIAWNAGIGDNREKVAKTGQEVALLDEKKNDLQKQRANLETRYQDIAKQRDAHYQDFSRNQAWAFILFGVATLIADIPLSLRLVATGFGVKTSVEINGQLLRVDDILSFRFFDVVSNFWEALVLAIGIAFASILLKYFFDLVVFRQEETEQLSRMAKALVWGGLILFLLTTVCLGVFRYRIQPQVEAYERRDRWEKYRQQKIDQKYGELLDVFSHEENPTVKAREEAEKMVNSEIGNDKTPDFNSSWGLPTFILLTLLLPIVTAVCFSVGGRKFRKAFLFDSIEKEKAQLTDEIRSTTDRLSNLRGRLAGFETELEAALRPDTRDDLLQRFRYLYRHGYERGLKNVPATMEPKMGSVYELSLQYLQRMLARRIRSIG